VVVFGLVADEHDENPNGGKLAAERHCDNGHCKVWGFWLPD
jgi:hypothetical protein